MARKRPSSADRLLDGFLEMYEDPDGVDKAYLARALLHCTLPHSNPGNVDEWSRTNGNYTLTIQARFDRAAGERLYPYGTLPRLILYWIVTEATKTKSRKLYVGESWAAFIRELGLEQTGGGKRGTKARLLDQMKRLLRATISFEYDGKTSKGYRDLMIGTGQMTWWEEGKEGEFQTEIYLSEEFFKAVTERPVPVDRRALKMLKGSSLALDLYGWIVAKTWQANKSKAAGSVVDWEHLYAQMGGEYAQLRDFKRKALKALADVRLAYPQMKVQVEPDGLMVLPAPTPIEPRG